MLLEHAVKQLLEDSVSVMSFVSDIRGTRIFPGIASQSADYPLLSFRPPNGRNRRTETAVEPGIRLCREIIQVYSSSQGLGKYEEVAELDDAIFNTLHEFSGTVINTDFSPVEPLTVQLCLSTENTHSYLGYDDRNQTHHFMSEFEFVYQHEGEPVSLPFSSTAPTSGFQTEDLSAQALPSGTDTFTLLLEPVAGSFSIFVNGIRQVDYVLTGLTVQLAIFVNPGDTVFATYFA